MKKENKSTEPENTDKKLIISDVSESLLPYVQWITGLLTAKYGITGVDNMEVATEIVKFCSSEHRYLTLNSNIDEKVLNDFKDAWRKMNG